MATKRTKERRRGTRREGRNERMKDLHSGGGEWDCIRIPEGIQVFKPEDKATYHIDIIPYIVGKMNPAADDGDEYWELSYPVYNGLGVDEKRYVAIGEFLGTRDPVAEHFAALRKSGAEWEEIKDFKPKWRQLMLVFVHEQADKGLQLYEGAFGTFGEMLKEELEELGEEVWAENFDDPDGGATIKVRFKGTNIGTKNPWIRASKVNIEEREDGFTADGDAKLAEEVLAKAAEINLENCLKLADYDTLKAVLDGTPTGYGKEDNDEGDDADEDSFGEDPFEGIPDKPKKPAKQEKPKKEEPEEKAVEKPAKPSKPATRPAKTKPTAESLGIVKGGEVTHDEYGLCTVLRVAKDGLTVTIMDDEDNVYKDIDPTDLEPADEPATNNDDAGDEPDEQTPPPAKSKSKKGDDKAPAKGKKDEGKKDDDNWDDDWDD